MSGTYLPYIMSRYANLSLDMTTTSSADCIEMVIINKLFFHKHVQTLEYLSVFFSNQKAFVFTPKIHKKSLLAHFALNNAWKTI